MMFKRVYRMTRYRGWLDDEYKTYGWQYENEYSYLGLFWRSIGLSFNSEREAEEYYEKFIKAAAWVKYYEK